MSGAPLTLRLAFPDVFSAAYVAATIFVGLCLTVALVLSILTVWSGDR